MGSDGIAFHWGETCGNDVIEGYATTPEPASLLLFGSGMLCLAYAGRRSMRRRRMRQQKL